jgi:hypothetical protein
MARLFLCAGLQSSGSTLVSWCFLQRPDMDGVLDARFDMLPSVPAVKDNAWCKFTIACFRFSEVKAHLQDEGWSIAPLLVVRDVRAVFNSLIAKSYGRNGTTADDPPIRLRLRRFKEDWQMFRDNGWPILRFESLLVDGEKPLEKACRDLDLPWDDGMIHWQKEVSQIAAAGYGNETFIRNRKVSLVESIDPRQGTLRIDKIPLLDLRWMEEEFAEFNSAFGYPPHVQPGEGKTEDRAVPGFEHTRRYERIARQRPVLKFFRRLSGAPLLNEQEISVATGIPSDGGSKQRVKKL